MRSSRITEIQKLRYSDIRAVSLGNDWKIPESNPGQYLQDSENDGRAMEKVRDNRAIETGKEERLGRVEVRS